MGVHLRVTDRGIGSLATPVPFRRMLYAQIGLALGETLFGPLPVSFIAIATMTAAARARLLSPAVRLARAVFAAFHEDPRSRRNLAQ